MTIPYKNLLTKYSLYSTKKYDLLLKKFSEFKDDTFSIDNNYDITYRVVYYCIILCILLYRIIPSRGGIVKMMNHEMPNKIKHACLNWLIDNNLNPKTTNNNRTTWKPAFGDTSKILNSTEGKLFSYQRKLFSNQLS